MNQFHMHVVSQDVKTFPIVVETMWKRDSPLYMAAHRATSSESASESSEQATSTTSESVTLESETLESETLGSETSSFLTRGSTVTYDSSDATDDTADSIHGITPPRIMATSDDDTDDDTDDDSELESSDESETYHLDPETVCAERSTTTTKTVRYTSKKRSATPLDRPGPSVYPRVHIPISAISVVVMNHHHTTVHVYGDAYTLSQTGETWHDTTVHASDIPAPLADLYALIPTLWRYAPRRVRLGKNANSVPLKVWPGPDRQGDHPHALKSCYTIYIVM